MLNSPSPPDLGALVLHLRAPRDFHVHQHMGRAVYRLGLTLIGQSNPELAQQVHDLNDAKPYTASGLMRGNEVVWGDVEKGEALWVRFTGLSAPIVAALVAYQAAPDASVEIDRQIWPVEQVEWDTRGWAGLTSYQILIERHRPTRPTENITLHFRSAATFHSNGVNMPLPIPSLVFDGLLTRWCTFTPHRLRDLPKDVLSSFMRHHILLSQHEIQSALYRFKDSGKEVGFVGWAQFEMARKSVQLQKHEPELEAILQREYTWLTRMVGMLADFARFSGVGRKTANGMGMVGDN